MANKLFPDWEDANKVIEKDIMDVNFDVYVNLLKKKQTGQIVLYIGFLPASKPSFEDLSNDRWEVIHNVYKAFMNWANTELSITDLLKLQNNKMNVESANNFKSILQQHIKEYENEHNVDIKTIFKACLGIGDISILPRQLQKEIYGEIIK